MLNRPAETVALVLTLVLAAGCSSTAMSISAGGAGGGSGSGGAGGHGDEDPCAALQASYVQTLAAARSCNPFLDNVQCTKTADQGLLCPGCAVHVNDTTVLDQLRADFAAAGCATANCEQIACAPLPPASCVPNDGGPTGTCS